MIFDKPKKIDAILSLHPEAQFVLDKDHLMWHSPDIPQPSDEAISSELARLEAEYAAQEYARLRKAEYDQLNQYEMMFDDQVNGTTTWVDAINAIKAKYPKE